MDKERGDGDGEIERNREKQNCRKRQPARITRLLNAEVHVSNIYRLE